MSARKVGGRTSSCDLVNVVSAGFSQLEAAREGGGSEGDGEFYRRPTTSCTHTDVLTSGLCAVPSGTRDPDGTRFTGLCQNQDVSPVGGSKEATGHRSGAGQ